MPFASLVALISPPMMGKYSTLRSIFASLGIFCPPWPIRTLILERECIWCWLNEGAIPFMLALLLILLETILCWRHFLAELDNGFQAITSCADRKSTRLNSSH